ncbi:hypothetical protein Q5P01_015302 [Channa striata]|uniref:Natterin-3-like n=1 Tax=Channa striata TaxID=64152 RepID=A0AA88MH39_CHASR|nr:hypothetical protein Q5P01_015302 [Channa striata]
MKLLLLLLLVVLVLISLTHQESVKENPQNQHDLVDILPEIRVENVTTTYRRIFSLPILEDRRLVQTSPPPFDYGRLTWQTWTGSLPSGAVSIDNAYTGRVDYVCKHGCYSGFYSPETGSYCYYPYEKKENRVSSFEILVNKENFETIEWKGGSFGSVPRNSVKTCSSDKIYVGKNQYGLGMVVPKNSAFCLPWEGSEYWYSWFYQVLTIKKDVQSENVDNVVYNINRTTMVQYPPETIHVSTVTNKECSPVSEKVTLSKKRQVENRWDFGGSLTVGVTATFSGGIPRVASSQVTVSAEASFKLTKGSTVTEEVSHSISVELKVPPNHQCKVLMMGQKFKVNVPFTARLSRTYSDGKTRSVSITGTYDSVQVGEVNAQIDRCERVSGADDCP